MPSRWQRHAVCDMEHVLPRGRVPRAPSGCPCVHGGSFSVPSSAPQYGWAIVVAICLDLKDIWADATSQGLRECCSESHAWVLEWTLVFTAASDLGARGSRAAAPAWLGARWGAVGSCA